MSDRSYASTVIRLTAVLGVLGAILFQLIGTPVGGAQQSVQPATHRDGPQVSYLFGSGSTTGGRQITLRVKLTGPAPAGGVDVAMTSERPDIIPVPATVEVAAGETETTFKVTTTAVTADIYVRVSASYGMVTKGREVLIKEPDLRVLYLQSVIRAGGEGKITVCLTGIAPTGGVAVNLTSDTPGTLVVPATIIIPVGKACASINASANEVKGEVIVRVTASYDGLTRFRDTTVRNFSSPTPPTATPTNTATSTATATNTATATATSTTTVGPTFSVDVKSGVPVPSGGTVVFEVCLTSGSAVPYTVTYGSSADTKAEADGGPDLFAAVGECEEATLTDVVGGGSTGGQASLEVFVSGVEITQSAPVSFPSDPTPTSTATSTATSTSTSTATATATNTPL